MRLLPRDAERGMQVQDERPPSGRPPRLVLRFAVYTGLGITLAAASILLIVRHFERSAAERGATLYARQAAALAGEHLTRQDFVGTVSPARRAQLDRLFNRRLLRDGTLRVELIDLHGRITYSTEHARAGRRAENLDLVREAIAGTVVSDATSVVQPARKQETHALEAFAAVRFGDRPTGVFALAQDYGPIAAAARRTFVPVVGVLELVLLGLYIVLFPILRRVTSRMRRQMETIEYQVLHDALTGLPNRTHFAAMVEDVLTRSGGHAAVMLVDLDRFKDVNDTLGHASGDLLLAELGQRLVAAVSDDERVARLGGDEFGIVSARATDARAATELAEHVRVALARPIEVAGVSLEVQASAGIALAPEHCDDADELLRMADVAMYAAKRALAPQIYAPSLDENSPARLALVSQLRHALTRDEIVLHYQPQIDLRTGALHGVEALVRWRHPRRGMLAPDEFLPVAEHAGLMRALTRHVLEQALRQACAWNEAGYALLVAVNVSGRDLVDSRLSDEIAGALHEHGVDPTTLELEITESTLLSDPGRAAAVLGKLGDLGVRLAIDDYGTGYSSLAHLKRLPVDALKIDKSFVTRMTSEPSDAMIVRSTIDLAHSLGLRVVAEGVEDETTRLGLAGMGCDIAQGYLFSRPLPAAAVTEWLRSQATVVPLRRPFPTAAAS